MTWKLYGSAWKCFCCSIMTERERQDMNGNACSVYIFNFVFLCVKIFFFQNGRKLGLFCFRRSMTITWSRDKVWWKCECSCGCRVMETLPRGNYGWKLMTNGGAASAQVLDSCPLTYIWSVGRWCPRITNWPLSGRGLGGMTQLRNFGTRLQTKYSIQFQLGWDELFQPT